MMTTDDHGRAVPRRSPSDAGDGEVPGPGGPEGPAGGRPWSGGVPAGPAPGRLAAKVAFGVALALGAVACGGDDRVAGDGASDEQGAGEEQGGDDGTGATAQAERQAEVADRGAGVMPFDLEATTHHFEPVADGLVQTVVADDPSDQGQVTLIRQHLEHEAERFASGDFGDPASIHGEDMPGLAELEARADEVTVTYEPTSDGGRITYGASDSALVDALHAWADAQVADHGSHAEHGGPSGSGDSPA